MATVFFCIPRSSTFNKSSFLVDIMVGGEASRESSLGSSAAVARFYQNALSVGSIFRNGMRLLGHRPSVEQSMVLASAVLRMFRSRQDLHFGDTSWAAKVCRSPTLFGIVHVIFMWLVDYFSASPQQLISLLLLH